MLKDFQINIVRETTMGRKCVVPFCRGGYNPTKKEREEGKTDPERKVTVFGFPEDEELKKTWIAKIPRKF